MINHDFQSIKRKITTLQKSIERGSRIIPMLKTGYEQGKQRTQKTLAYAQTNASTFFNTYSAKTKQNGLTHFTHLKNQLQHAWQHWKPSIDSLVQTSIAIATGTSAFNRAIKIAPIIFSVLSVLTTAPLISAIVPSFLLHKTPIILILSGISIFAGHHKYYELIKRADLDAQIKRNQEEIRQLRAELERIKSLYTPSYTHQPPPQTRNSSKHKHSNSKNRIRAK